MSTRADRLHPMHIEALNLIDIKFRTSKPIGKKAVSAWKPYRAFLHENASKEVWTSKKTYLLADFLLVMADALGYYFDKTHKLKAPYYPKGYIANEQQIGALRTGVIGLLEGTCTSPVSLSDKGDMLKTKQNA